MSVSIPAEDWSRFRGPNGSGVSADGDLTDLTRAEPHIAWTHAVPSGKSSPVLTQHHVYITAEEPGRLLTLCFDRQRGRRLWMRSLPRVRQEHQHSLNSPAASTPVTDGQNVYAFFRDFGLVSYDAAGTERWRKPLGPFNGLLGLATSPILVKGMVVIVLDQLDDSNIIAIDQRTGKEAWRVRRPPFAIDNSTPLTRRKDGREEIIVVSHKQVKAYAPEDGKELWTLPAPAGVMHTSPVIDRDTLYFFIHTLEAAPSFDAQLNGRDNNRDGRLTSEEFGAGVEGRNLMALADFYGNRDGVVERAEWDEKWKDWADKPGIYAIRLPQTSGEHTSGARLWSYHKGFPRVSSPLLYKGLLYSVGNGGILTALDANTGAPLQTGRLRDALGDYYSSPVAAGGKILVCSEEGKVVVIEAGAEWKLLRIHDCKASIYATPAVSKNEIFVRTATSLVCFRPASLNR